MQPPQQKRRSNSKNAICPFCQRRGHKTRRSSNCAQNPRNLAQEQEDSGDSLETAAAVNSEESHEEETNEKDDDDDDAISNNDARELDLLDSLVIDNDKFFYSFDNEDDLEEYEANENTTALI